MRAVGDESGGIRRQDQRRADGFVWCSAESLADTPRDEAEDGFEWAPPLVEQSAGRASATPSETLDPTLVTSQRLPARDDDAVARLAALKHDPASGRWQRVESAFVERAETD